MCRTEGIQSLGSPGTPLVESASECTAQAFSASRSVKLRAACVNTSTVSIASLSHNSAAIDEEAGKLVLYGRQRDSKFSLQPQGSHRYGRAPRLSGWKKTLA